MKKRTDTIVINGRSYHAGTGELLSHGERIATNRAAVQRPVSEGRQEAASRPAHTGRHAARHTAPHRRERTHTLMRQAVKRPGPSVKRRARVQAYLEVPSKPHAHRTAKSSGSPSVHPTAIKAKKSQLISHFSPDLFAASTHITLLAESFAPVKSKTSAAQPAEPIRRRPLTTEELLEFAVQQAQVPIAPLPRKRRIFRGHAVAH